MFAWKNSFKCGKFYTLATASYQIWTDSEFMNISYRYGLFLFPAYVVWFCVLSLFLFAGSTSFNPIRVCSVFRLSFMVSYQHSLRQNCKPWMIMKIIYANVAKFVENIFPAFLSLLVCWVLAMTVAKEMPVFMDFLWELQTWLFNLFEWGKTFRTYSMCACIRL